MLPVIDERMKDRLSLGYLEYLYRTEAIGRALYGTLMNMVDMANYWGDVKTDHSEVARLSDASHAYLASALDTVWNYAAEGAFRFQGDVCGGLEGYDL